MASCWIFYTNYTMMQGTTNIKSLSSCCCSMLVPIDALKQLDNTFNELTPFNQLQNQHVPLIRRSLRLHRFFTGALFPKFNRMVERELLTTGVQHIEDIFSIMSTNLFVWLSILGLGATDVCAEMRKTKRGN